MTNYTLIFNIMELTDILWNLWLNENESRIYMVNLELWLTQVANISWLSGIKRTTLYGILERMEEKWIIKKHVKNNVSYYEACNPDELYESFAKQVSKLKSKLPELQALNNKFSSKPKIYYFEWAENVAELYKMEAKDQPDEVCIFSSNADRKSWERDILRKIRNDIYSNMWGKRANLKLIMNRDMNHSETQWDKFHGKKIEKENLDIGISIKVYGNKTKFISMKESITWVVIENKEIADTMKSIFEYIYEEKSYESNIIDGI